jgi:hypothetical protein
MGGSVCLVIPAVLVVAVRLAIGGSATAVEEGSVMAVEAGSAMILSYTKIL